MFRRILVTILLGILGAILVDIAAAKKERAIATFAGGCFWCMEAPFDDVKGVVSTISGFTGGHKKDPSYDEVSSGKTGHCEAVQVEFDPGKVTYAELLNVYWHNVDPTSANGQFCDRGNQYRAEIFYHGDEQKQLAEASRKAVEEKFGKVVVAITAASKFYPAEEYHQDFYTRDPERYHEYRSGCGRDRRLKELWGDAAVHGAH